MLPQFPRVASRRLSRSRSPAREKWFYSSRSGTHSRLSAMSHGSQENTLWVAEPTPRPDDRLHWLHRVAACHEAPPPGSLSTQAVATRWLSPESTNRMQFHARCLPAQPASASAANGGEQQERSRRAASTGTE